jgi:hypothetical protein
MPARAMGRRPGGSRVLTDKPTQQFTCGVAREFRPCTPSQADSPRLQLVLHFSTVSMVVRGGPRTNAVIVPSWPGPLKPIVSPARVHPDVAARAHVPKFRLPSHSTGLLASTAPLLCPLLVITTWLVVHGPVSVPRAPV